MLLEQEKAQESRHWDATSQKQGGKAGSSSKSCYKLIAWGCKLRFKLPSERQVWLAVSLHCPHFTSQKSLYDLVLQLVALHSCITQDATSQDGSAASFYTATELGVSLAHCRRGVKKENFLIFIIMTSFQTQFFLLSILQYMNAKIKSKKKKKIKTLSFERHENFNQETI